MTVDRSHAARTTLLLSHTGLVHSIARQFSRRLRRFYEYEDLIAIGQEALWRATGTWDPDHLASFLTYGHRAVLHTFLSVLKHWQRRGRRAAYGVLSIEGSAEYSEARDLPPLFQLCSALPDPEALALSARSDFLLARAFALLEPRDRRVLQARFEEGTTLDAVAEREGLTRERIRQLERRALGRLRERLEPVLDGLREAPSPVSLKLAQGLTARSLQKVARQRALT